MQLVILVFHFHLTGVFDMAKSHLQLTICPRHRKSFVITWRSNKRNCAAPISVKGEGITLSQFRQLFQSSGALIPMA